MSGADGMILIQRMILEAWDMLQGLNGILQGLHGRAPWDMLRSVQYKELKLGSHSGHAKTNLSGHCVKMSGHYFLKVTPILKYMIYMKV